ncbi:MAG: hypothetical protein ACXWV9_07095 [Flavisolibacter sp.]
MKKIILSFAILLFVATAYAQSEKYQKTMLEKVALIDSTWESAKLKDLSAAFERIADAEKTQWLPYYYAALTQVNMGLMSSQDGQPADAGKIDAIADKADALLAKAEGLSKNNSEIYIIKKMIANLRMAPAEMPRYMKYGPEGAQALETAKKLNSDNPRVLLLEAQDKFYTPEQFGGSKTEAKKLFEQALVKFDAFKPASSIDPGWGKTMTQYFIAQIK